MPRKSSITEQRYLIRFRNNVVKEQQRLLASLAFFQMKIKGFDENLFSTFQLFQLFLIHVPVSIFVAKFLLSHLIHVTLFLK